MATRLGKQPDHRMLVKVLQRGRAARQARATIRRVLREAGVDASALSDAENAVAELAANAEIHGHQPYELRIVTVDGAPTWCEVVDGDEDLNDIPKIFSELRTSDPAAMWFWESGRGLLLVFRLSAGRCATYLTRTCATGQPGKAVAFALPTTSTMPTGQRSAPQLLPTAKAVSPAGCVA